MCRLFGRLLAWFRRSSTFNSTLSALAHALLCAQSDSFLACYIVLTYTEVLWTEFVGKSIIYYAIIIYTVIFCMQLHKIQFTCLLIVYNCIVVSRDITYNYCATKLVSMAEGGSLSEEEIDHLADAVMTLRRSGLFIVEPLPSHPDVSEKASSRPVERDLGDFVNTRPRGTGFGRGAPGKTKADQVFERENPFKLEEGFGTSTPVRTPLDRRPDDPVISNQPTGTINTPLIPPASFAKGRTSTPWTTSRFAPVFSQQRTTTPRPLQNESIGRHFEVQNIRTLNEPVVYARAPRISTFSGSAAKGEAGFEDWRFEVRCLMRDGALHDDELLKSVRISLKGEANRVAMHLGEDATLENILQKLERVYGTVESGTTLLQKFYNCRQEEAETIGAYGCRLEDVLSKAISRGAVAEEQSDGMLRNKLWSGLKDERVRNATRYKLEQIHSFDELIGELRAAEQEIKEFEGVSTRGVREGIAKAQTYAPQNRSTDNGEPSKKAIEELTQKVKCLEDGLAKQHQTNKTLSKILERIEALERGTKATNSKGPLSGDRQKSMPR